MGGNCFYPSTPHAITSTYQLPQQCFAVDRSVDTVLCGLLTQLLRGQGLYCLAWSDCAADRGSGIQEGFFAKRGHRLLTAASHGLARMGGKGVCDVRSVEGV